MTIDRLAGATTFSMTAFIITTLSIWATLRHPTKPYVFYPLKAVPRVVMP